MYEHLINSCELQVGLRLRFCTGAQDTVLRVCAGMKAEPGDELTVSQVLLQPLHFVEVVNPHAECGLQVFILSPLFISLDSFFSACFR